MAGETPVSTFADIEPPIYEVAPLYDDKEVCSSQASMRSSSSRTISVASEPMPSENPETSDDETQSPPSYTPALTKLGVLKMKPELSSPFTKNRYRSWRSCLMEVNNTQLKLTYPQFGGFATKTQSFSLQFAEVGLATDYGKRPYSFRLRVETKQLIFDCENRNQLLGWLVSLQMAISLALPLELRQLPEEVKRLRNRQRERERRAAREQHRRRTHHSRNTQQGSIESSDDGSKARSQLTVAAESQQVEEETCLKWKPTRRSSRFSEKDFPHLLLNTTWEGKYVIYQGKWACIQNREIVFIRYSRIASMEVMKTSI